MSTLITSALQQEPLVFLLSTDPASELDVLWEDCDAPGVDGTEVGVLKERYKVALRSLLEGHDSMGLETQVSLKPLGHLSHEALEWELADEKISRLLVPADLTESNGARPEAMRLLHASCKGTGLATSFDRELLAKRPAPGGGLVRRMLNTRHSFEYCVVWFGLGILKKNQSTVK
jgi:hypothetical protein